MGHDDEQVNTPAGDERQPPAGEPQPAAESVEQYVHLHEHIERLRADRRPCAPGSLSEDERGVYQMAALFHAATPGADELDRVFVSRLLGQLQQDQPPTSETGQIARGTEAIAPMPAKEPPAKRRQLSRRAILGRTLGAAAVAAAAGVAGGMAVEQRLTQQPGQQLAPPSSVNLVPDGSGIWVTVAKADAIPIGGVLRFTTDYVVGFVRHTSEGFSALSGICTHMGCMLLWNPTPRTFDCPCHGGRFTEDGASAPTSAVAYKPLPTLRVRVEDNQVQVYVLPPTVQPSETPSQQYG